jgi:hypothetical protein
MATPGRIGGPDDDLTPEERAAWEKKLEFLREMLAWAQSQGLQWDASDKNALAHPQDKDLSAWRDPYTGELLLSPKLAERLMEEFTGLQRGGPATGQRPR